MTIGRSETGEPAPALDVARLPGEAGPILRCTGELTAMTALCERAEADARCRFCSLFHALGGRPEDIGCRSVLEPIRDAVRRGDGPAARERVASLIRTLEQMPVGEAAP